MKKLVIALTAVAAFSAPALAADIAARPYTKAPAPVVSVVNWTGCYVAGGGGYGLWNQENTRYDDRLALAGLGPRVRVSETATAGGRGYFGTVQGGCDYQFALGSYNLVVGAFGDYDFASMKGQLNLPVSVLYGQEKLTDTWSVGGRIGWLVTPSLLTYFTGGYTESKFGRVDLHANFAPAPVNYINSQWYKGWFIGAGDEYALSFLPGLFWKTEYRFSELDRKTNPTYFTATNLLVGDSYDSKKYVHTIRSELVYRFNWGGTVVAKY
jgi:outer membrane immunogenic protein